MDALLCRCQGSYIENVPCEITATEEDGLCDSCRSNGCEAQREETLNALRTAAVDSPVTADILERRGLV
jgi:hypothetical protein